MEKPTNPKVFGSRKTKGPKQVKITFVRRRITTYLSKDMDSKNILTVLYPITYLNLIYRFLNNYICRECKYI
jgi:hypothetical protein